MVGPCGVNSSLNGLVMPNLLGNRWTLSETQSLWMIARRRSAKDFSRELLVVGLTLNPGEGVL